MLGGMVLAEGGQICEPNGRSRNGHNESFASEEKRSNGRGTLTASQEAGGFDSDSAVRAAKRKLRLSVSDGCLDYGSSVS